MSDDLEVDAARAQRDRHAPRTIVERGRARRNQPVRPALDGAGMSVGEAVRRGYAARVGLTLVCVSCFRRPGADAQMRLQGGAWTCQKGHLALAP